jgi:hypothetical protein
MNPVVKRILVHGGFTAGVLALVGVLFAELASMWASTNPGKPGSADLNPPLSENLRYRVPLTLAGAGFLFVAVGELVARRLRDRKQAAAKAAQPQPDEAERLLNELLAQAEAKMAAERGQGSGVGNQESGEQKPDAEAAPEPKKPETPSA